MDSTARRQSITLGNSKLDGWIEVAGGLNPGDEVVAEPLENLKDGQRVKVTQVNSL